MRKLKNIITSFTLISLLTIYSSLGNSWALQRVTQYISIHSKNDENNSENFDNSIGNYFIGILDDLVHDGLNSVTKMPSTYKNMFVNPFKTEQSISTSVLMGSLSISFLLDRSADNFFKKKWEPHCDKYVPEKKFPLPIYVPGVTLNHFYTGGFIAIAEYSYFLGLFSRNDKVRRCGYDLMQATAYSFFLAQSIKALSGRARPQREHNKYDEHSPWEWGNSNTNFGSGNAEYNSFPSFHATWFYSYWTVLMGHLGYKWSGPIISSFFYFQISKHNHWLSDMVAGGILGYWLGSSILENSNNKIREDKKSINFCVTPIYNGGAIHLILRL